MNSISINPQQWDISLKDLDQYITSQSTHIEFHYESDFKNAKILRDCVEYILKSYDISAQDITRYVLACDEMNNNAIEHGSQPGDTNVLRLEVDKNKQHIALNIQVQDSWNGKTAKTAQQMQECREHRTKKWFSDHTSIRGRWLFLIIINIVDELYFDDADNGGLIVWFKKDLDYSNVK